GPIIRGIDAGAIPRLRGYVATTPKDLADVILRSHQDDPVLATWRCSLGKAAAFTSDASARWARDWLAWGDYRKFWAQVVRWASRGSDSGGFRVSRETEGGVTRVVVDAIDEEGRFVNYLRLSGRSLDARGRGEEIPFRQIGPGRYAAEVAASAPGTTLVHIAWKDAGGETGSFATGVSVPYSREYRDLGTNDLLLEEIARAAGGRVADAEEVLAGGADPYRRDLPFPIESRSVWATLLVWAAWLMLADVFVRRVAVDWARVWAWILGRIGALLGRSRRERAADPRLQALLRTKAAVRARAMRGAEAPLPEAPEGAAPDVPGVAAADAPPAQEAPKAGSDEAGPGYTQRLLRAKRRAIRREEDES
ncbi:MAG: hypothetical protein JXP34_13435, partial [Planctomycetes bacterium]|nr:hypothetical protein [Planctomycetota bacterium]